jgi:hypothetical protein
LLNATFEDRIGVHRRAPHADARKVDAGEDHASVHMAMSRCGDVAMSCVDVLMWRCVWRCKDVMWRCSDVGDVGDVGE